MGVTRGRQLTGCGSTRTPFSSPVFLEADGASGYLSYPQDQVGNRRLGRLNRYQLRLGGPLKLRPRVVVNRRKNASNLDGALGYVGAFELKSTVSARSGRKVSEFGTVKPRVQIPGPRPKSEYDSGATAGAGRAPYHSRITISRGGLPALRHGARMSRPNVEPGLPSALDPPSPVLNRRNPPASHKAVP